MTIRKIWIVRPRIPLIDSDSSWLSITSQLERYRDINRHIDVRYIHKETAQCVFITAHEDDATPYRQLKDRFTWFETETEALQYLYNRISEYHKRCIQFAEVTEGLMLDISATGLTEANYDN